jgi:hypothetical protein
MSEPAETGRARSPDQAQINLATANAVVMLADLLVSKGLLTAAEVAGMLDRERGRLAEMDRPVAAQFTALMADSFRSTDDGHSG